jgi:hypothetical protein
MSTPEVSLDRHIDTLLAGGLASGEGELESLAGDLFRVSNELTPSRARAMAARSDTLSRVAAIGTGRASSSLLDRLKLRSKRAMAIGSAAALMIVPVALAHTDTRVGQSIRGLIDRVPVIRDLPTLPAEQSIPKKSPSPTKIVPPATAEAVPATPPTPPKPPKPQTDHPVVDGSIPLEHRPLDPSLPPPSKNGPAGRAAPPVKQP